jgi:hypothetical protein
MYRSGRRPSEGATTACSSPWGRVLETLIISQMNPLHSLSPYYFPFVPRSCLHVFISHLPHACYMLHPSVSLTWSSQQRITRCGKFVRGAAPHLADVWRWWGTTPQLQAKNTNSGAPHCSVFSGLSLPPPSSGYTPQHSVLNLSLCSSVSARDKNLKLTQNDR